jgi:hypothetical protein
MFQTEKLRERLLTLELLLATDLDQALGSCIVRQVDSFYRLSTIQMLDCHPMLEELLGMVVPAERTRLETS